MSDTASYSDLMFGLFWCLGYQFSPRLAEMKETRFWRIDPAADYQVCIVLEQKSGLSYKVASQAEREEIQKKRLITSVVITVPLLHVYMTTIYFFHDIIGLKPLSCSVAPQTPYYREGVSKWRGLMYQTSPFGYSFPTIIAQ